MERRQFPRPQRVLLVDDDADVRAVWREWLTLWHFNVVEAVNGLDALARARSYPPDVIIMDVTMPLLDGFSAAERLKDDPSTTRIQILLLSADAGALAAGRAKRTGGDAFLSKPIRAMTLLQEIRRAFRRLSASTPRGTA